MYVYCTVGGHKYFTKMATIKNQLLKHPISLSYLIKLTVIKMSKMLTVYNWGSKLKNSVDGSDVILTTLVKFHLPKKMARHNKEMTTETNQLLK